jgi:hypothetical protein
VILFPVIALLLILALLAELFLLAREAMREHRFRPTHHPTLRAVAILTVLELVLVLAWAFLAGQQR